MIESIIKKFDPDVCYDIGAHNGEFSRLLRQILPNTEIHQFEGSPKKVQKAKVGPWHKTVLSKEDDGRVTFYHDGGTGDTYMRETDQFLKTNYQTTVVKTRRLDTYVDENFLPYPDFIKIDVQGAELDVLVGCNDILNRCKLIHCEIPAEGIEFNSGSVELDLKTHISCIDIIILLTLPIFAMPNFTNVKEKIQQLEKQQRLMWPMFDQELKGKIFGSANVGKFIMESFKQSKLEKDLALILPQRSIEQGIK